ncbi:hypothetical protein [uncultured Thiodictyon sp.]|uniref:hypothetical protein n=1 Tax=uncultured Thiodictyon sp. TaxID=1846217 RepID=UPI0025CB7D4D|nr:hypothetical protein [uncultured Thiodictyon sp.]
MFDLPPPRAAGACAQCRAWVAPLQGPRDHGHCERLTTPMGEGCLLPRQRHHARLDGDSRAALIGAP